MAIHSVVVAEPYRKRGIATRMLQAYIQRIATAAVEPQDHRAAKIVLLSKAYLLAFYVKCGFQVIEVIAQRGKLQYPDSWVLHYARGTYFGKIAEARNSSCGYVWCLLLCFVACVLDESTEGYVFSRLLIFAHAQSGDQVQSGMTMGNGMISNWMSQRRPRRTILQHMFYRRCLADPSSEGTGKPAAVVPLASRERAIIGRSSSVDANST
jgi:Acetyltransferase (GNAT) domain